MEMLYCKNCDRKVLPYTILKGNNNVARCTNCNTHLGNIGYAEPALHFGKYKGTLIKDVEDVDYLQWVLRKVKISPRLRNAINERIKTFQLQAK